MKKLLLALLLPVSVDARLGKTQYTEYSTTIAFGRAGATPASLLRDASIMAPRRSHATREVRSPFGGMHSSKASASSLTTESFLQVDDLANPLNPFATMTPMEPLAGGAAADPLLLETATTAAPVPASGTGSAGGGASGTGATGVGADTGTTGTTGNSGKGAGTGVTGGATGPVEAGPMEDDGPSDFIVTAELDCVGASLDQVNQNMDAIVAALGGIMKSVAQDKIEITAEASEAGSGVADAEQEAQITEKYEDENKEKEAAGVAPESGVAAATALRFRRRRLLSMISGPNGVRLLMIVRGVTEDAGAEAVNDLVNAQSGTTNPTLTEALQRAGLVAMTSVSFTEGKAPKSRSKWELGPEGAGCTGKIEIELAKMAKSGVEPSALDEELSAFCKNQFEAKKEILHVDDSVIQATCTEATKVVDEMPEERRLEPSAAGEISNGFCAATRRFFVEQVQSQDPTGTGPSLGVAHSFSQIMQMTGEESKAHSACCLAHATPGCFDRQIEMCVCQGVVKGGKPSKFGKMDSHCCDGDWDLTCTENVEIFHCAACPAGDAMPQTTVEGYNDASQATVENVENLVGAEEPQGVEDATGAADAATGAAATGGEGEPAFTGATGATGGAP
jgi:hypothetical protein